jgi:hypothetical protein
LKITGILAKIARGERAQHEAALIPPSITVDSCIRFSHFWTFGIYFGHKIQNTSSFFLK